MKAHYIRLLDGKVGSVIDYGRGTIHLAPSFSWINKNGTMTFEPPYSKELLTHQYLGIADIDASHLL